MRKVYELTYRLANAYMDMKFDVGQAILREAKSLGIQKSVLREFYPLTQELP